MSLKLFSRARQLLYVVVQLALLTNMWSKVWVGNIYAKLAEPRCVRATSEQVKATDASLKEGKWPMVARNDRILMQCRWEESCARAQSLFASNHNPARA
jgi:hypothetical protein